MELQRGEKLTLNFTANIFFLSVKFLFYGSFSRNVGGLIMRLETSCHKDKTDNTLTVTKGSIFRKFEERILINRPI